MPIDQLALLILVVIAANALVLLVLAFAWRGRRGQTEFERPPLQSSDGAAADLPRALTDASTLPPLVYQRVTRVSSLAFIVATMVVVVLTSIGPVAAIVVFLAAGAFATLLFQEILPVGSLGRLRLPIEAAGAIVFLTVLLVLTGGQASPFFFGYILLLGAASFWASGFGPLIFALATGLAYLIGVLVPFNPPPTTTADYSHIAFNIIALALAAYVSAIVGREQRHAREEALRLSRFDSLTGLHSRAYFLAEIEQEILRASRSARPFALLMFDLDGLKAANDRFGHASGDALLRAVAETLRGDIRITDIAARYGGDEFVLLLPETDLNGAMLVADKVRVDIGRLALPNDGLVIRTSASIGLVTFPDDGRTSTELMRRADLAMYEAKRRGRDQVVRFAREIKHIGPGTPSATGAPMNVGAPPMTAPVPTLPADSGMVSGNGMAGDALSGVAAPAVVIAREAEPVVEHSPGAARDRIDVPPAWPGRAPWESTGN